MSEKMAYANSADPDQTAHTDELKMELIIRVDAKNDKIIGPWNIGQCHKMIQQESTENTWVLMTWTNAKTEGPECRLKISMATGPCPIHFYAFFKMVMGYEKIWQALGKNGWAQGSLIPTLEQNKH